MPWTFNWYYWIFSRFSLLMLGMQKQWSHDHLLLMDCRISQMEKVSWRPLFWLGNTKPSIHRSVLAFRRSGLQMHLYVHMYILLLPKTRITVPMRFSSNGISSSHKSELEVVPWVQEPQGECIITNKGGKRASQHRLIGSKQHNISNKVAMN